MTLRLQIHTKAGMNLYSTRELNRSSDKLLAFSGMAQRYESMLNDTYIAGLWRSRLVEDLHWALDYPVTTVAHYRAPSWSWMSIVH